MSGALKTGAASPTLAEAAGGTAVARSIASALIATSAAMVKVLIGTRMRGLHPMSASTLSERVEHARRGQKLRQHDWLALAGIEEVERDATAAELLQEFGNFRILAGPVALERHDTAGGKGFAHRLAVEGEALVDQTGDAPGSGQIDENGLTLCLQNRKPLRGERLVAQSALCGGVGRHRTAPGGGQGGREEYCHSAPGGGEPGAERAAKRSGEPRPAIDPDGECDQYEPK